MSKKRIPFEAWKLIVDLYVSAKLGLGTDDLPDLDYYGWWAKGISPAVAANRAVNAARQW